MQVPHLMDETVGPIDSEIQEHLVDVVKMIPKELVQEQNCSADRSFSVPQILKGDRSGPGAHCADEQEYHTLH